jgi:hypothetical protein
MSLNLKSLDIKILTWVDLFTFTAQIHKLASFKIWKQSIIGLLKIINWIIYVLHQYISCSAPNRYKDFQENFRIVVHHIYTCVKYTKKSEEMDYE